MFGHILKIGNTMAGCDRGIYDLPFRNLSNYSIANLFQTSASRLNEILLDNGISKLIQRSSSTADMFPISEAPCEYFNNEDFNYLVSRNKFNFSTFHQNIRSLSKHVGKFWSFLNSLNYAFDIIMLSEIGKKNYHIA